MTMHSKFANVKLPASPCYLFDVETLHDKVDTIKSALPHCNKLCFAMKANPFLVQMISDHVDRFEVCSPGEYEICHTQKIDPSQLIISGVNKTEESMRRIMGLSGSNGIYTIESPSHYEILSKLAKEMDLEIQVMIRLSSGNQFGVDRATLESILQRIQQDAHCHLAGIHYFSGTQKKLKKIEQELNMLNTYAGEWKVRYGLDKLELEYGPGLAVSYFEDDHIPSAQDQLAQLDQLLGEMNNFDTIGIEMGRFIAADCGTFVTKVIDLKKTEESTYVILDGGIHQLHYFGQMMGMKLPPMQQLPARETEEMNQYVLCGSLCTINDVLVRSASFHQLHIGDTLLFGSCGAYSMTESIALFLSRELPAVYEYTEAGEMHCLRAMSETYPCNTTQKGPLSE